MARPWGENWAIAIRRLGELMKLQKETVGLAPAGRPRKIGLSKSPISKPPTLKEAGISKNMAHEARKQAAKPAEKFEFTYMSV